MDRFNELIREMTRANMAEMALCGVAGREKDYAVAVLALEDAKAAVDGFVREMEK